MDTQCLARGAENLTLRAHTVPPALPIDQIWLERLNDIRGVIDVHAPFIWTNFSIVLAELPERLQPGNAIDCGLFQISDKSFEHEHLVVILVEPDPLAPVIDLSYLGQTGAVSRGIGAERPPALGLQGVLGQIGVASATRVGLAIPPPQEESGRGDVLVFSFEATPP